MATVNEILGVSGVNWLFASETLSSQIFGLLIFAVLNAHV